MAEETARNTDRDPVEKPEEIPSIAQAPMPTMGRLRVWPGQWDGFEVTDDELDLIASKSGDAALNLSVFLACGSTAIGIACTLSTSPAAQPSTPFQWWPGIIVALGILSVVFLIKWSRSRSDFQKQL